MVIGLDEEARLKTSLESVLASAPAGYQSEIIYVDSGSKDKSVEIAQGMPGVSVNHLGSDKPSAAKARNRGLKQAKGEFVQLVDGDSVIQPGWMEAALDLLEKTPEVACVFGQCIEIFPEQSDLTSLARQGGAILLLLRFGRGLTGYERRLDCLEPPCAGQSDG